MMKLLVAVAVVLGLSGGACAETLTLKVVAEPSERAEEVKLSGGLTETTLNAEIPKGGVESRVDLPSGVAEASLFVVWSDSRQTAFPLLLASAFADQTVQVFLIDRTTGSRPAASQVRQSCDQTSPAGLSALFNMFFTCKAFALALEDTGEQWDPDYRRALSGWLVANYKLATLASPVSPYGLDPDLRARLEDALDKEAREHRGAHGWAPLRLQDARQLLDLADALSVRLVGYVPVLVQQGAIPEAIAINDAAIERFNEVGKGASVIQGINEKLLLDNQAFLETLIR